MAKNSIRNLHLQIQKAQRTINRINMRKTMQGTSQNDENQKKKKSLKLAREKCQELMVQNFQS